MPLSEKKKASNLKWDSANLKRMSLAVPVDQHKHLIEHTEITGETVNSFLKRAINETIIRDDWNFCGIHDEYNESRDSERVDGLTLVELTKIKAVLECLNLDESKREDRLIIDIRDRVAKVWKNAVANDKQP